MKNVIKLLMVSLLFVTIASCDDTNKIDYVSPVDISFEGVDGNNIVQVDKGVTSYKAIITITATTKLRTLSLFEADIITGAKGNQIGKDTLFTPLLDTYTFEFIIDDLTNNKAIMVVIEDADLMTFSKKLLVKVYPSVLISDLITIETADAYYGSYYASWKNGRVYLRKDGGQYGDEIDFSLGNIAITGTDTVPAFISSDLREGLGLPFIPGLKGCKFELSTVNRAYFDAITPTMDTAIDTLVTPTLSTIKAEGGKIYVYENETEKGLMYVGVVQTKKAPGLEQQDGSWLKNQTYHQLKIFTKSAPKN